MAVMTKRVLVQSFSKLLKQKPLKKITVQDIADDCGVSRMTFYYHFKDIHHLLQWTMESALEKLFSDIKQEQLDWREGCVRVFRFVLARKDAVAKLLPEMDQSELCLYLYRVSNRFTTHMVNAAAQGKRPISEEEKQFLADNAAFCLIVTLLKWSYGGMREEPECLVAQLAALLENGTECALSHFAAAQETK